MSIEVGERKGENTQLVLRINVIFKRKAHAKKWFSYLNFFNQIIYTPPPLPPRREIITILTFAV